MFFALAKLLWVANLSAAQFLVAREKSHPALEVLQWEEKNILHSVNLRERKNVEVDDG